MLNGKYKTGGCAHNEERELDSDWASREGFVEEGPIRQVLIISTDISWDLVSAGHCAGCCALRGGKDFRAQVGMLGVSILQ